MKKSLHINDTRFKNIDFFRSEIKGSAQESEAFPIGRKRDFFGFLQEFQTFVYFRFSPNRNLFEFERGEIFGLDVFFRQKRAEIVLGKKFDDFGSQEISIGENMLLKREIIERNRRIDCRKLLAYESNLSIYFEYLTSFPRDVFDICIDVLKRSVLIDERLRFLRSESWDSGDIIRSISADSEIIHDMFWVDCELFPSFGSVVDLVLHRVVNRDISVDELIEILVSREYEDVVLFVSSEIGYERSNDIVRLIPVNF